MSESAPSPAPASPPNRRTVSLSAADLARVSGAGPKSSVRGPVPRFTVARRPSALVLEVHADDDALPVAVVDGDEAGDELSRPVRASPNKSPALQRRQLGRGVPQTAGLTSSFAPPRPHRNQLGLQAALGNLRLRQASATTPKPPSPSPKVPKTPLSATAPVFAPRANIASPSPTALEFNQSVRRRVVSSPIGPVPHNLPSLEQLAASWKRKRAEAAAARSALESEWPAHLTGDDTPLPLPELDASDQGDSSTDDDELPAAPPSSPLKSPQRAESGRKLLTALRARAPPTPTLTHPVSVAS